MPMLDAVLVSLLVSLLVSGGVSLYNGHRNREQNRELFEKLLEEIPRRMEQQKSPLTVSKWLRANLPYCASICIAAAIALMLRARRRR
jgi:hypothetical protein